MKRFNKLLIPLACGALALATFPPKVLAAHKCGESCSGATDCNPGLGCDLSKGICVCLNDAICTGLGCIPTDPEGLVSWLLSVAIKVAGGIALLLLSYGGIKIITTKGDPKAFDEAKGTITAALTGLLVIILTVLILKVIGYDILQLPGWGAPGGKLELPD